jgi:hypothetical protein
MAHGENMDTKTLLETVNPDELTVEAPNLIAWKRGLVDNMDDVAQFMYRGGPYSPQASAGRRPEEDRRPEKRYWDLVKEEMGVFLCKDDKRYRELWKRIAALEKKSTTALVGVIAAFLGQVVGAPATLLAGFVAVCLYAVAKLGKEAYCRYINQPEA